MTSERAQAYGRVIRLISAERSGDEPEGRGSQAPGLAPEESDFVRMAADTMLFAEEMDSDARTALDQIATLGKHLVESGRWDSEQVSELVSALAAAGPQPARVG
jgi:Arc/MetJ-type ribon-helix-helix transcriptional regulator